MHYCQSCDTPVVLEPLGEAARCPECGGLEEAASRKPLFVVTGASGSGKTAVFEPLARRLSGLCVTFDVDWLLDSAGALAGGGPIPWPAFRDAWLAIAHAVAQGGMPTVLLGPFMPEHLEGLPAWRWVGDTHYLVLDCPDDLRRHRIELRPPWRRRDVQDQTEFGRWLRDNIADSVDTSAGTPEDTADAIADWVARLLATPLNSRPTAPGRQ